MKVRNSLKSLRDAIDFEARRQVELIESGESVVQQTRLWNENTGVTAAMRSKEEAYDYRYFLEPDLVPLVPDAEWIQAVADTLGMMPAERRARLGELLAEAGGPTEAQADQITTVVDLGLDDLAGKVFLTSGLGGMSGAQAKAATICDCIGIVAEV